MTTTSYKVTGMTCGHCVNAVTSELGALDGVSGVSVDLVSGGTSLVTVTSAQPLDGDVVSAALDEAGGYEIAGA
jgi:copper chaperone CopZ